LLVNADPTALAAFPQHIRFCRKSLRCYQRGCCLGFSEQFSTVEGRLAFWKAVHERMGKLANRANDPGRILGQLHNRIPMVILDEQHELKLGHAEAHERFWTSIWDGHEESIEGCRQLIAQAEQQRRASQAEKAKANERSEGNRRTAPQG
jgi:hypothetical protein